MIPLGKLLTLLIKTFSKPMLNYAKKMNTQQRMTRMNSFFIWVGRKSFQIENFMNYSIRKMKFPTTVKQISDDSAL